jgi:hypothetical protein
MKPRHTHPDENQNEIEHYLHELGFWTYRTANDSPQKNSNGNEFHPLDLLVLGKNRANDRVELTMWEIKTNDDASVTEQEATFLKDVKSWFRTTVPINVATDIDQILRWYGWIE